MNQNSNPVGNPRVGEPRITDEGESPLVEESEYGRFKELADKLTQVSKEELDEQREDEG